MKLGLELYPHLLIRQVASVALYHARTLPGATCATWVWQQFFFVAVRFMQITILSSGAMSLERRFLDNAGRTNLQH